MQKQPHRPPQATAGTRHFTPEEAEAVNAALQGIAQGKTDASDFIARITPWKERITAHIASQVVDEPLQTSYRVTDAADDTLHSLLSSVAEGKIDSWNAFSQRFQSGLRDRLEAVTRQAEDPLEIPLAETKATVPFADPVAAEELHTATERYLERRLAPRHKQAMEALAEGGSKASIARELGVKPQRVTQIVRDAEERLKTGSVQEIPEPLHEWNEGSPVNLEAGFRREAGRQQSYARALGKLNESIDGLKYKLANNDGMPVKEIAAQAGYPEDDLRALLDANRVTLRVIDSALAHAEPLSTAAQEASGKSIKITLEDSLKKIRRDYLRAESLRERAQERFRQ